jgi:hypothetical protein
LIVTVVLAATAAVGLAEVTSRGLSSTDVIANKPPGNSVPSPPDPNVILQGGDTCDTATVIASLPYSDDGTTVGYTNDYDEVCPYSGSLSPDVVYAYTPAADTTVNVSLCVGTTNYDTKLYIYEGSCPGAGAVACNDDSCAAPLFPSTFISSVEGVALTGGQTYYFVVDGYGGDEGPYTIDISEAAPPPACPTQGTLHGQPVHPPSSPDWGAYTSGEPTWADYTVYDSFTGDLYSITDFHWWGLSLFFAGGFVPCDPTGMAFDIRFYADNAGEPGAEVCAYTGVAPTITDTGLQYAGFSLYYWEIAGLTPACEPTGLTWVSVKSLANTNDCALLWMSGTGGDSSCLQFDASTGGFTPQVTDVSMCITGDLVPVELQSINIE